MSQKQNNKVVSFRRPPNGGNIGVVIFAAIFIYIIICVFMYFTQKHIESYQVKMGSLSSNNVYKGIALRDEEIISATKSGYINYYAREGQRVGVGNLVYTIDESGKLADYLNTNGEGTSLTDKDLSELKTEILGFVNSFDHEEFTSVYDFKNSVQGMVQKLSSANILDNIDKINSSGVSELVSLCTAPATGIVVFSTDGYEQLQLICLIPRSTRRHSSLIMNWWLQEIQFIRFPRTRTGPLSFRWMPTKRKNCLMPNM